MKIGFTRNGAFAEYVSVPAECVYELRENPSAVRWGIQIVRAEKILRRSINYTSQTWKRTVNLYRRRDPRLDSLIAHRVALEDIG